MQSLVILGVIHLAVSLLWAIGYLRVAPPQGPAEWKGFVLCFALWPAVLAWGIVDSICENK